MAVIQSGRPVSRRLMITIIIPAYGLPLRGKSMGRCRAPCCVLRLRTVCVQPALFGSVVAGCCCLEVKIRLILSRSPTLNVKHRQGGRRYYSPIIPGRQTDSEGSPKNGGSTGCRIHTGRLHRTTDSQQQQQRRRRRRRRRRRKPPAPVNSIRIRMKTLDTIVCPMRNVGKGFHSQRRKD
ncbi:predicted protein [Histoplasma mississippiense (nom. inval.)]|uniref:predicted protein n=1 Tax=Ajellomyces capsulatus (strain NAm1 / WU24) TaxID=2059318 RepID=UPI000157CD83|nr:predicted protein [Histoplasma mississippiense (nom. inval.)]EDN10154.1 predicted protein [Histoplasma mississippiense (nom. inval.)]